MTFLVAVVMVSLAIAPAYADDKAKAAAHYKQGKAFFDAQDWDDAIREYQAAYARQPRSSWSSGRPAPTKPRKHSILCTAQQRDLRAIASSARFGSVN